MTDVRCVWCGRTLAQHDDATGVVRARVPCLGLRSHFMPRGAITDGRRLPQVHVLKCWPDAYEAIADGRKRFEFRYNDRDYRVGDVLSLREFAPSTGEYTGRELAQRVTYVLAREYGMPHGYVVMSLEPVATP